MISSMQIHSITLASTVNGPGRRNVLHTQGCSLGCPGCFNAQTHPSNQGELSTVKDVRDRLLEGSPEGISISGGEPFQQAPALLALVRGLREASPQISILIFSGYAIEEIQAIPGGTDILNEIDVLVDGRFVLKDAADEGLRGSKNQRVHLLSTRHTPGELGTRATEILIAKDGTITLTGFPEGKLVGAIRSLGGPKSGRP